MRILFDQGTPVPLRRYLTSHVVDTAFERGWSALHNGALLDVAEQEGYDLLITTDQNLRYQQRLADRQLAIIVLLSTSWLRMQSRVDTIQAAVASIVAGGVRKKFPFDEAVQSLVHITLCMLVWEYNRGRSQWALWFLTSSHR
jgi:hypothetical protein